MVKFLNKLFGRNKVLFLSLEGTIVNLYKKAYTSDNNWKVPYSLKLSLRNYNPQYVFILGNSTEEYNDDVLESVINELSISCKTATYDFIGCESKAEAIAAFVYMHNLNKWQCMMIGDSGSEKEQARKVGVRYMDVVDFFRNYVSNKKYISYYNLDNEPEDSYERQYRHWKKSKTLTILPKHDNIVEMIQFDTPDRGKLFWFLTPDTVHVFGFWNKEYMFGVDSEKRKFYQKWNNDHCFGG